MVSCYRKIGLLYEKKKMRPILLTIMCVCVCARVCVCVYIFVHVSQLRTCNLRAISLCVCVCARVRVCVSVYMFCEYVTFVVNM